jgi:hypothetical protein
MLSDKCVQRYMVLTVSVQDGLSLSNLIVKPRFIGFDTQNYLA